MKQRLSLVRLLNALLLLLIALLFGSGSISWHDIRYALETDPWAPAEHRNALALGDQARGSDEIEIAIQPMEEFDGWARTEIAKRRRAMVARHPELVQGAYQPSRSIFGQIVSGKPWWGIIGQEYLMIEDMSRSTEGPSEESRQILNPFVLLWPEHWNIWYFPEVKEVRKSITNEALHDPNFPLILYPHSLTYYPRQRTARLRLHLNEYRQRIEKIWGSFPEKNWGVGGLNNYNARDFGLPFLIPSVEESKNIKFHCDTGAPRIAETTEYVHLGGSCRQPGGCNNMSGSMGDTGCRLEVEAVPASLVYHLWGAYPEQNEAPALRFILEYL